MGNVHCKICNVGSFISFTMSDFNSPWLWIPEPAFLHILSFLSARDVLNVSQVCKTWRPKCLDNMRWRQLFERVWGFPRTSKNLRSNWLQEYKRLYYHAPVCLAQTLTEHQDEVLHVAFSHGGTMFATSSKDCHAMIWEIKDSLVGAKLYKKMNFLDMGLQYTQYCEFSPNDHHLLVSGVHEGRFSGAIFIWKLDSSSEKRACIYVTENTPYDVFGTWFDDSYFLSGGGSFEGDNSFSELWLNYIGDDPRIPHKIQLLHEISVNNSIYIRQIQIARDRSLRNDSTLAMNGCTTHYSAYLIYTSGHLCFHPHQVFIQKVTFNDTNSTTSGYRQTNFSVSDKYGIETNSHIIGITVSSDHRSVLVNCRALLGVEDEHKGYDSCPGISGNVELRMYGLSTRQLLKVFAGHQAFTPMDECFIILLSSSPKNLVASGSEDSAVYIWDCTHGINVAQLSGHSNVVNCVAFNPRDPEMLVSVSDDHNVCVWKSRCKTAALRNLSN